MTAENPEAIAEELDKEKIDGILVLDEGNGRWYLGFASSTGIVGQRTARRQADSIVRSGYTLPDGYWLKANYPMEELSDPNIGDLWQSVQQKYVKDSSLTGMDLDAETGIPAQLADRAKTLEKEGMKDELSEAKFEKEEAEQRKKAATKSTTQKPKPKKTSKQPTKQKLKTKEDTKEKEMEESSEVPEEESGETVEVSSEPLNEESKTESQKKTRIQSENMTNKKSEKSENSQKKTKKQSTKAKSGTKKPVNKKRTKKTKSTSKSGDVMKFLEIKKLVEYVHDGHTRLVAKGELTKGTDDPISANIIIDQKKIPSKQWNEIAIFLGEGDIVQITTDDETDGIFATNLEV